MSWSVAANPHPYKCLIIAVASHQDLALQRNAARQPPDRLPDSVLRGMASVFEAPSRDSAAPGLATITVHTLDIPPENASAVCGLVGISLLKATPILLQAWVDC